MSKVPIACTLTAAEKPARTEEWRAMLACATTREATAAGARLTFPRDVALASRLADLAAREVDCCGFFTFTTTFTHDTLVLDVSAPPEAWELVTAFATDA